MKRPKVETPVHGSLAAACDGGENNSSKHPCGKNSNPNCLGGQQIFDDVIAMRDLYDAINNAIIITATAEAGLAIRRFCNAWGNCRKHTQADRHDEAFNALIEAKTYAAIILGSLEAIEIVGGESC